MRLRAPLTFPKFKVRFCSPYCFRSASLSSLTSSYVAGCSICNAFEHSLASSDKTVTTTLLVVEIKTLYCRRRLPFRIIVTSAHPGQCVSPNLMFPGHFVAKISHTRYSHGIMFTVVLAISCAGAFLRYCCLPQA